MYIAFSPPLDYISYPLPQLQWTINNSRIVCGSWLTISVWTCELIGYCLTSLWTDWLGARSWMTWLEYRLYRSGNKRQFLWCLLLAVTVNLDLVCICEKSLGILWVIRVVDYIFGILKVFNYAARQKDFMRCKVLWASLLSMCGRKSLTGRRIP